MENNLMLQQIRLKMSIWYGCCCCCLSASSGSQKTKQTFCTKFNQFFSRNWHTDSKMLRQMQLHPNSSCLSLWWSGTYTQIWTVISTGLILSGVNKEISITRNKLQFASDLILHIFVMEGPFRFEPFFR